MNEWDLPEGIVTVGGGDTRFDSVRNGLRALVDAEGFVSVHDAVRPLVSAELIARVFEGAEKEGNAVPVVQVNESIRRVEESGSSAVVRDAMRIVQTPQCFRLAELRAAYEQPNDTSFTDCATVMEKAGHEIHLVNGEDGTSS